MSFVKDVPRIRGRVGKGEEDGKFYCEISVWDFGGEEQIGDPFVHGPYDSELEAKRELRHLCEIAVLAAQESLGAIPTGKYIDLKDGGKLKEASVPREMQND